MLDREFVNTAMGSQGNGLISRGVIYSVTEALKSTKDIVVGIVWSHPDRYDFYNTKLDWQGVNEGMENPTGFGLNKYWAILNARWNNHYARKYYRYFHDSQGAYITTLEHILRTQWFLKQNNINYFMSTYTSEVLLDGEQEPKLDSEHLYNMIDQSCFLPVSGLMDWVRDEIGEDGFPVKGDNHPSSDAHKQFTDKVIVPYMEKTWQT